MQLKPYTRNTVLRCLCSSTTSRYSLNLASLKWNLHSNKSRHFLNAIFKSIQIWNTIKKSDSCISSQIQNLCSKMTQKYDISNILNTAPPWSICGGKGMYVSIRSRVVETRTSRIKKSRQHRRDTPSASVQTFGPSDILLNTQYKLI